LGDEGRLKRGKQGKIGRVGDWGKRLEARGGKIGRRGKLRRVGNGGRREVYPPLAGEEGLPSERAVGLESYSLLYTRYWLLLPIVVGLLPAAQKSQLDSRRQAASR